MINSIENHTRNNHWMLTIGISLWFLGLLALFCIAILSDSLPERCELPLKSFLGLLNICIIGPFLEEFALRGWVIKKEWINLLVITTFFIVVPSDNVAILAFSTLVYVAAIKLKKNTNHEYIIVLVTSLLFSLLHLLNYDVVNIWLIPLLVTDFGMGLVLCYLALRYGLWSSIIVHGAFNSLSVLILLVLR